VKDHQKKSKNWILKPQKNLSKSMLKSEKKYSMADMRGKLHKLLKSLMTEWKL